MNSALPKGSGFGDLLGHRPALSAIASAFAWQEHCVRDFGVGGGQTRRDASSAQEGRTCHDMWRGVKARVSDLLDQAFVPREMILRANDRVTVIRLPIRTQKVLALSAVALLGWTLLASGTFVAQELIIASKNRAIEGHKLAYFELLRSEEHTSELKSLMRTSYAAF